jgi:uncharacterized protein (DUF1499 family)
MLGLLEGSRPENLGVRNNQLSDCPEMQNCVTSNSAVLEYDIDSLPFTVTAKQSIKEIQTVLLGFNGISVITAKSDYLHVECKSFYLGFVDDLEVYCDESKQQCLVRSASRLGYSDFGVNRKRVEKIRKLLNVTN